MNKLVIMVSCIRLAAAQILGRPGISLDEVEKVYKAGTHPELNERIDYLLAGI